MSDAAVEIVEVEPGVDPLPRFEAAWSRGARVLPLARSLPPAVRDDFAGRARAIRCETSPGIVLATSGSSGAPRLIDLSLEALRASAELGVRVIPFGPGDTWHASLAPSHVGGVMILMRARFLGGSVRFAPQPRAWRDLDGCTHVSLVATQLARLLEDPAPVPSSLAAVMLGGGPSAQTLHDAAIARGVPLYSSYGMTETCSQVATGRRVPGDAATLAGPPLPEVAIAIDPATSEILVDGPTLARGEFVDGALVPLARPLRTRDAGSIDDRGRLHVLGRLDSMFISGGKNIHPESIERAVGTFGGVRSCCVIGVPDATWGARPVAFVDLAGESARDIRSALRDVLPPHEIPDAVYAMPADEAASAKPSRARLAARHACGERFDRLS